MFGNSSCIPNNSLIEVSIKVFDETKGDYKTKAFAALSLLQSAFDEWKDSKTTTNIDKIRSAAAKQCKTSSDWFACVEQTVGQAGGGKKRKSRKSSRKGSRKSRKSSRKGSKKRKSR